MELEEAQKYRSMIASVDQPLAAGRGRGTLQKSRNEEAGEEGDSGRRTCATEGGRTLAGFLFTEEFACDQSESVEPRPFLPPPLHHPSHDHTAALIDVA